MEKIDWAMLREQKAWLFRQDNEFADGILNLLDAIQDEAVASGIATEEEVFGELVDSYNE